MVTQTRYERVPHQEPWNPHQKTVIQYAGLPGGWHSWFFNELPNVTHLMGGQMPSVMTLERPGNGLAQPSKDYVQLMGETQPANSITKLVLFALGSLAVAGALAWGLSRLMRD